MANEKQNKQAKRRKPNYIYSIISMALVLFVLGLVSSVVLQMHRFSVSMKEQVEIQLALEDNTSQADGIQFTEQLKAKPYTREVTFVTKDEAAERMKEQLGEDFIDLLGFNPLFASVNLRVKADYANADSLTNLTRVWMAEPLVNDVSYDKGLIKAINQNIKRFALLILGLAALLFIIALILMDNTIRLSMFSNRFIIRSMKLVGATQAYITRPFVWRGIINGFLSAVLAIGAMLGVFYAVENQMENFSFFSNAYLLLAVVFGMLVLGILISLISTWLAVRKYMNMKLDNLY